MVTFIGLCARFKLHLVFMFIIFDSRDEFNNNCARDELNNFRKSLKNATIIILNQLTDKKREYHFLSRTDQLDTGQQRKERVYTRGSHHSTDR